MPARTSYITGILGAVELLLLGVTFTAPAASAPRAFQAAPSGANIARHRPYTLSPAPNYALTSDAGDSRQLTDEEYAAGTLWTQVGTVGWSNVSPVTIVIDLGSVQPISGVSFDTAAGAAGVEWPRSIFVLVSDDGKQYFPQGDLVLFAPAPQEAGYTRFRFVTRGLQTRGRYVALVIDPSGSFTFCDEIEVYAGDRLTPAHRDDPTTDLLQFFRQARTRTAIARRLTADLNEVRAAAERSSLSSAERSRFGRELDVLAQDIPIVPPPAPGFRTVLPLNATHARIFAVRGALEHALGRAPLSAWNANPFAFLNVNDSPPPEATRLSIAAMPGETRSGAVNLANSTDHPMRVALRIAADDSSIASAVHLYEVVWTDTRESVPVADALQPLPDDMAIVDLPAGMTRQIWVSVTPAGGLPRVVPVMLSAESDDGSQAAVSMDVRVLAGRLPDRFRLHLGGWDYTDRNDRYGLTPHNSESLIRQLRRLKVDAPWATRDVMPPAGDPGGRGAIPDTARFDRWVSQWPTAARYLIFIDAADALGNISIGDERFPAAVNKWISFWAAHAATLGIQPSHLMLLLVDEPKSSSQDARVSAWARAIRAAKTDIKIWENPNFGDPARTRPAMLDLTDVIAVERSLIRQHGKPLVDFYQQRRAPGQPLDIYDADGPVRLLDPYTYHRLQAWLCAELDADASFFWSFIDGAGSWNEYAATNTMHSPFFMSEDDVTMTKHSEAILEGQEDFEYIAMLRDRVASLAAAAPDNENLADARRLLETAVTRVLRAPGSDDLLWRSTKDRSMADRVRLEIADMLVRLQQ